MDIIRPLVSIVMISLLSTLIITGVFFVWKDRKILNYLNYFVALSVGMLFANSFLHLLPEAYEHADHDPKIGFAALLGILGFFAFENFFHWRHEHDPSHEHPVGYMNFVSDAIHKIMDGVIITTAYSMDAQLGNATTVAILFHEIPQRIGNFGVLLKASFSPLKALWFSFIASLFSIGGVLAVYFSRDLIQSAHNVIISFIAGMFIYIAGTDLMPQLHRDINTTKSVLQFLFLIMGMMIIALFSANH
jgi:zinc and cadmium transporter